MSHLSKNKELVYRLTMDNTEMQDLSDALEVALDDPKFYELLTKDSRSFLRSVMNFRKTTDLDDQD